MADLDELYGRVDICERLLYVIDSTGHGGDMPNWDGATHMKGMIIFPFINEANIMADVGERILNYGLVIFRVNPKRYHTFPYPRNITPVTYGENNFINIPRKELLFLNKTKTHYEMIPERYEKIKIFAETVTYNAPHIKKAYADEMMSQLIPAPPDAVESITRETINEALFETRLKIHEIKTPPYVIGNGNPLLTPRMNLFMPTESPPVMLRPISPRPLTPKQVRPRLSPQIPENTNLHSSPIVSQIPLRSRTPRHSLNLAPRKSRRNKNRQYAP